MSLPGCDGKVADLFEEWKSSHSDQEQRIITSVKELEESQTYQVLKKFESIWGVGADTATNLYYTHGYRRLGDIISHHWNNLSRVQQIGVKYYDEFLTPIPRREVQKIATLITSHAEAILPGVRSMLVGGYRRGKEECGDVDLLISHPVEDAIKSEFLINLLRSLENAELITHTLSVSSPKLQHEDPHRPSKSNFDTLDKALLVWQAKKGRLHRRVDIIVAPTVCAGTALLGWTGATTFERDLRLYCEKQHQWKFSSEGVWRGSDRVPGTEGWRKGESWEDVEKRVLETIGVGWRPPTERCTD
jgi:DNA polymerase IV